MSSSVTSKCGANSGLQWSQEWQNRHNKEEKSQEESGHRQSETAHDLGDDVWDELEEVSRIHREKQAEEVINYLESRLSQLTTVDSKADESTSPREHDLFARHHKEVVKKGAGKQE